MARTSLADLVAIDLRSLAVFRVGLAITILCDLGSRAGNFTALHSDAGLLPRAALVPQRSPFFAYMLDGSATATSIVAWLALGAALLLAVGLATRFAAVVSWFLLGSLHLRNPEVLDGADRYLLLLLFWAMFLPLGERWSVDARRRPPLGSVSSPASAALLCQVVLFYLFAGLLKLRHSPMWLDGSAAQRILAEDDWQTSLGAAIVPHGGLLRASTFLTLAFELGIGLLLFSPWRTSLLRTIAIVLIAAFHLSIAALIDLGTFSLVCIVGALPFIPATWWRASVSDPRLIDTGRLAKLQGFVAGFTLLYVVLCNIQTVTCRFLPPPLDGAGAALRVSQHWGIYLEAPERVPRGFPALRVSMDNGETLDLARDGAPFSQTRAGTTREMFPSLRLWSHLRMAIVDARLQAPALQWACRQSIGGQTPRSAELLFIDERSNALVVAAETHCQR
jgi:uncharacterized membrane protein YphA (DoxX/SURF4 family)